MTNLPPGDVTDIKAVHNPDPGHVTDTAVLFAAHSGDKGNNCAGAGIYQSNDGGKTWNDITSTRNHFVGNNADTVFNCNFVIPRQEQLTVYVNNVKKTFNTHYTLQNVGTANNGRVTFIAAPANGAAIVVQLNLSPDPITGANFTYDFRTGKPDRIKIAVQAIDMVGPDVNGTSATINPGGKLTAGDYTYRITFLSDNGVESAPSTDVSVNGVLANHKVTLTNLPTKQGGTAARRIYRKVGDGAFTLVATINENTTTTFIDTFGVPVNVSGGQNDTSPNVVAAGTTAKNEGGKLPAGDYIYRITFLSDTGVESKPSADVSVKGVLVNQTVTLSNLPAGPTGTEARRIYRKVGTGNFKLVGTVNDNSTQTFTDIGDPLVLTADLSGLPAAPDVVTEGTTATDSGAGGKLLQEDYNYRITFLSDTGVESKPSADVSITLSAANHKVTLTKLPTAGPEGTSARRIYRKVDDGAFILVASINDNYTTTFIDTLGTARDATESQDATSPEVKGTTAAKDAGGKLTTAGDYTYEITFLTPNGFESAPSDPVTIAGVEANNKVKLSNIPTGPPGTAARRIYRKVGAGDFKLVGTVTDNTTRTFTDWRDPLNLAAVPGGLPAAPVLGTAAGQKKDGGRMANGTYNYKITYLRNDGVESQPSNPPITVVDVAAHGKVELINLPKGLDTTVARRIYRSDPGVATYTLVGTLNDNTTTTFVDTLESAVNTPPAAVPHLTRVHAMVITESPGDKKYRLSRVFCTDNLGANWRFVVDTPGSVDDGSFNGLHKGQGKLHFSFTADPWIPDRLYMGGDTQFQMRGKSAVNNMVWSGRLFVLDTSAGISYVDDINNNRARGEQLTANKALRPVPQLQGSTGATKAETTVDPSKNLTAGVYKYKITFVDKTGVESNPSTEVIAPNLANKGEIKLTNIPKGPDGTERRNIYRTKANENEYFYVGHVLNSHARPEEFPDNVANNTLSVRLRVGGAPVVTNTNSVNTVGGGPAAGNYIYKITFSDNAGFESEASAPKNVANPGGGTTITLTNIPIGPQDTYYKYIYRATSGAPNDFRLVGYIKNHVTDFTDNKVLPWANALASEPRPPVGTAPHADSRFMVFDSEGRLLQADDGGVYRMDLHVTGAWQAIVGDLQVTEVRGVAYNPGTEVILVGSQDNSSQVQTSPGASTWRTTVGGDGGNQAVGWNSDFTRFYHYSVANTFKSTMRETFDSQGNLMERKKIGTRGVGFSGMQDVDRNGKGFQQYPLVINAVDHERLLLGWRNLYWSNDHGDNVTLIDYDTERKGTGLKLSALAYGGREPDGSLRPDVIYRARNKYINVSTDNGATWSNNRNLGAKIMHIALDPMNWRVAYAVAGSKVWVTTDGGNTWNNLTAQTGVEGALPGQKLNAVQPILVDVLDLHITLRNGKSFDVTLRGARTVDDIKTWIEVQSRTDRNDAGTGRVKVEIIKADRRFVLEDKTVLVDTNKFEVTPLNASPAGNTLGLFETADNEKIEGKALPGTVEFDTKTRLDAIFPNGVVRSDQNKDVLLVGGTDGLFRLINPVGDPGRLEGYTKAADSGELATEVFAYRITFLSDKGVESAPSAIVSVSGIPANHKVTLTNLPTGPDNTAARRIYRQMDGTFKLVGSVNDRTTTTFTDLRDPLDVASPPAGLQTKPDVATPGTAAADGGVDGKLTGGNYTYRITFLFDKGVESAPSDPVPAMALAVTENHKVNLTNLPPGLDGTVARRIYRKVDGGDFKLVGTVNDKTTATFTDLGDPLDFSALPNNLPAAPDVAKANTKAGDGGELTAKQYTYRITFLNNAGVESAPSVDILAGPVAANHKVTLMNLPTGPDDTAAHLPQGGRWDLQAGWDGE